MKQGKPIKGKTTPEILQLPAGSSAPVSGLTAISKAYDRGHHHGYNQGWNRGYWFGVIISVMVMTVTHALT